MRNVLSTLAMIFIINCTIIILSCGDSEQSTESEKELPPPPNHPLEKIENEENGVYHGYIFADRIVEHNGKENMAFPKKNALNGVRGHGKYSGSLDVFVIGEGNHAVFEWKGKKIVNGEGDDFKIFENGFIINGTDDKRMGMDIGTVKVSKDGEKWVNFPVMYSDKPYTNSVEGKSGFVGLTPVTLDFRKQEIINPASDNAGGDAFDLSDAGVPQGDYIKYVKIVDGGSQYPDGQPGSNGIDIDGICAFYWVKY